MEEHKAKKIEFPSFGAPNGTVQKAKDRKNQSPQDGGRKERIGRGIQGGDWLGFLMVPSHHS